MKHNQVIFAGLFSLCSLASSLAHAGAGGDWDYKKLGDDWSGVCASGKSQSPININTSAVVAGKKVAVASLKSNKVNAVHNGHTVQFDPQGRQLQVVDNVSGKLETFNLLQFHIHNGSEHTVDDKRHELEAHFVHANQAFIDGDANGRLAVVGVFLNAGDDDQNNHWNALLANLPNHGEAVDKSVKPNYEKLLAEKGDFYSYEGSLTTPGCNEVVNWMVLEQPVTISKSAVASFAQSQQGHATYRNVQPIHGRTLSSGQLSTKL